MADPSANSMYISNLEDEMKILNKQIEKLRKDLEDLDKNCINKIEGLKDEISQLKRENAKIPQVAYRATQTPTVNGIENTKSIIKLEQQLKYVEQIYAQDKTNYEEKISMLTKENQDLRKRVSKLENENHEMKTEQKSLKEEFAKMNEKVIELTRKQEVDHYHLQELMIDKDKLCVRQLFKLLKVNMCMYVLEEEFDEKVENPKIGIIETFIKDKIEQIADSEKNSRANARLLELNNNVDIKKACTNYYDLLWLKDEGDNIAHRTLDEEMINRAIENLHKAGQLNEKNYKQVQELATMLKTLESM